MWKRPLAVLAVIAGLTACSQHAVLQSPQASSPGVVTPFNLSTKSVLVHYPLPGPATIPSRVALASDHNVWFNELNYSKIGMITPTGSVTEFNLPNGHFGSDIAAGATGTLWFGEFGAGFIGKITTAGVVTEFPTPPNAFVPSVTKGPDGNMWFTDENNQAVGKITPTGTITEFPLPTGTQPVDIVTGPDGNLWFVDSSLGVAGKVTTSGAVTEYPGPGDAVSAITAGADGKLYAASTHGIWQITTAGVIKEFTTNQFSVWNSITLGPDKQLWMTSSETGALIEFNPKTSKFSTAIQPDIVNGSPGAIAGLVVGNDGDVWIVGQTGNDIMVYEEKIYSIGIRLNGELSFNDPNYGFELGYAVGTGTQTQTISLSAGESVQFSNLDSISHSAAFLGNATKSSAPWPSSFNGSTSQSPAGTAIGTSGFATGPLNPGKKSPVYETGMPGFYMFGCQFHYNPDEMRTVIIVH